MRARIQLTRHEWSAPEESEQGRDDKHGGGECEDAPLVLVEKAVQELVATAAVAVSQTLGVLVGDAGPGGDQPSAQQDKADHGGHRLGAELPPGHPGQRVTSSAGVLLLLGGVR